MRTSKVWAWGAVAALTVGLVGVAVPANAAPPRSNSSPVATATASVPVGDSVVVDYDVNRAAKQIRQPVSCSLDGDALADCGLQQSTSKKLTSYSANLTGLEDGEHTFVVTFTLTDGGTATVTAAFTISTSLSLEETCSAFGGTINPDIPSTVRWECGGLNVIVGEELAVLADAMTPFCQGGFLAAGVTGNVVTQLFCR
jgi:hypothetical protein